MKYLIVPVLSLVVLSSACESSPTNVNSNTNRVSSVTNAAGNGNTNGGWTAIQPTNGSISNSAANAGINSTPTPGIPDPANFNKPFKPGATPTPGIPDAANIKKQMQRNAEAANSANANVNRPTSAPSMMSKKKQPGPMGNKVN